MHYLTGQSALSAYETQRLLERLQQAGRPVQAVRAIWVYWLDAADSDVAGIADILQAKAARYPQPQDSCWCLPRRGACSPWASQAKDIIQHCGYAVEHVERGLYFSFEMKDGATLAADDTALCFDRMTQACLFEIIEFDDWFSHPKAKSMQSYELSGDKKAALQALSQKLGLVLQPADCEHLSAVYEQAGRDPSAAELMMFSQINSEHCRHKVFNSNWSIDGVAKENTLFSMIKHTYKTHPGNVVVAYSDNAAVMEQPPLTRWLPCPKTGAYQSLVEPSGLVLKVETHNHPTGISPHPGAATGSGGEIRDEAATGRGANTKMGMVGFSVSNLLIPGAKQSWESSYETPSHLASAFTIMQEAPMGGAAYNNEFGRPALAGFFRAFSMPSADGKAMWGFHKPLMIAGGVGQIRLSQAKKQAVEAGDALLVLGGPGFLIGLGGGAMSSQQLSSGSEDLDFASVQRANPEMQRRAQEVIQACFSLGDENPIKSIHDVGAGGLCNALPELVEADDLGAEIDLRAVPVAESGMSPMEIWCNESQERYVLAVAADSVPLLKRFAQRERVPLAQVGVATAEPLLRVHDSLYDNYPVDMRMSDLFDCNQALLREDKVAPATYPAANWEQFDLADSIERVLSHPTVADKSFLITIGDRSVTGLVARDQMVGPWQVPVADVAVTAGGFHEKSGEAMAVGERSPVAILDAEAAAGLAIGEALTNLAAASIADFSQIILSANWMSAVDVPGEGEKLYAAVHKLGRDICPELQVCIPVGKDSLSMRSHWQSKDGEDKDVVSPQALVVTAAGSVSDITRTWTPVLDSQADSVLLLVQLPADQRELGASVFAQVNHVMGDQAPSLGSAAQLRQFFLAMQALHQTDAVLAYHDRADGGLLATVVEMMFAGYCGVDLHLSTEAVNQALFNESLGAVLQVKRDQLDVVQSVFDRHDLKGAAVVIGKPNNSDSLRILIDDQLRYEKSRAELGRCWSRVFCEMQSRRENPGTAKQEYDRWLDTENPGLNEKLSFSVEERMANLPLADLTDKPRVAILREQGVNGHAEMAAAFAHVGFEVIDVHMSDLLAGRQRLADFVGLVACGGFSYGDVLGAGRGWAQVILNHADLKEQFKAFFADPSCFALGVCNGCQMLSQLQSIIPGAEHWPRFVKNESGRFESRLCLVEVEESPSLFFQGMAGSVLSVVAAHGEGRAEWSESTAAESCLRYVDNHHQVTESYPANPNGTVGGQTAFTNADGRITIMMPHPERVFLRQQQTWQAGEMGNSPWAVFFANAARFVLSQ